jgi:hypothetical protein
MIDRMIAVRRLMVLLGIAVTVPAYGYIDPGSGALVIQAIISAAVGGLFLARNVLARIGRRMRRLFKSGDSDTRPSEPPA